MLGSERTLVALAGKPHDFLFVGAELILQNLDLIFVNYLYVGDGSIAIVLLHSRSDGCGVAFSQLAGPLHLHQLLYSV